jgi:hypothetical protein
MRLISTSPWRRRRTSVSKAALAGDRFLQDLHAFAHNFRIEVGGGIQEVDSVMFAAQLDVDGGRVRRDDIVS